MYATARRYSMRAGSIDALMHRIDEEFASALSQQPGFVCYFALDIGDGAIETISIFRHAADAERSNQFAAACVRENLSESRLTGATAISGEVLVSRASFEALDDAHRWRTARARARPLIEGPSKRPVLVVGSTGRTGRLIVDRLLERGIPVHALVRDPAKARRLLPSQVRQYVGDVRRSHTLVGPMAGVGAVIIATYGGVGFDNSAELVDYFGTGNLVRQAVVGGVELVVFISTIGATRPANYLDVEPTSLGWKARAEELIRASGVPYCIVRPGWLTDGPGGEPLSVSQGDTAEGRISRADLADVCTRLLFLATARGKTIDVIAGQEDPASSLESAIAASQPDTVPEPHRTAGMIGRAV